LQNKPESVLKKLKWQRCTVIRRRREAANISASMKTFHCYDIVTRFYRTDIASLEWPPGVEFALHPEHGASCDSEIQTKKVLKRKFGKQLGRLSILSLNSKDKEEAFESQG